MKKRTLAVAAFAAIAFASCLKNDGGTNTPRAGVLVDLLSPDATNTTVVLNGNTIQTNVSYGSVPNLYNQVTPGYGNLSVFSSTNTQLLNSSFNAEAGKYYSMFVVDSASKMKNIIVTDSVSYPATTDSVKVRFYNFAPNSPALNIGINDSASIWTTPHIFETQASANFYNTFKDMKAGTYRFQILTPFSTTPIGDTTISLGGKHVYTLFIKGFYPDTTGATKLGLGIVTHG